MRDVARKPVCVANSRDANGIFAMRNAEGVLDACSLREPLNPNLYNIKEPKNIGGAVVGDFESYEIVVKPRRDTKNKLLRTFLILFYIAFVVGCLVLGFITAFVPLLALVPLVLWIIIFFTWRYVNLEYEYLVESGVITFTKIYNNRTRKKALVFDIRSAEYIAPSTDADMQKRVADYDPRHEYCFAASKNSPDAYTVLFRNEDGDKYALTLTADEKIKKFLKMYNAAALRK